MWNLKQVAANKPTFLVLKKIDIWDIVTEYSFFYQSFDYKVSSKQIYPRQLCD